MEMARNLTVWGTALALIVGGCSGQEPTHIQSNNVNNPAQRAVASTINSDGSKTYIASTTVCADNVPEKARNQSCGKSGFDGSSVAFYAVGKDFIKVGDKSLHIEILEIDGVDFRKTATNEDNFKLGWQSKPSDDGKFARWEIGIPNSYTHVANKLRIKGSINAYTGSDTSKAVSPAIKLSDFESFTLGPVLIKSSSQKAFGIGSSIGLMIDTQSSLIKQIELLDGENIIKSNGWSGWENNKTYMFNKPATDLVKVKVTYWDKPEKVVLNFDFYE